jgi:undecaprenyl-diphosphatase
MRLTPAVSLAVAALCGAIVAAGAVVVPARGGFLFDAPVTEAVRDPAGGSVDQAARIVTRIGDTPIMIVLVVVVALVLVWRGAARGAVFVAGVVALAALVTATAKLLVARHRPLLSAPRIDATGYAYPSGHATATAALWLALLISVGPGRARHVVAGVGALVVVAVGASRVYLGVHYPTDVLAGWLVAVTCCVLAIALCGGWRRPR